MGFKCGIVGLPNVGKSTLFNALTETQAAQAANYPFCTIEPNVGNVAVPDPRLQSIAKIGGSQKIIETQLSFVDIAGLVRGASKGEGLGNQFLANIRETDAIAHVVRCFEDENVIHVANSVDPKRDIEIIDLELIFADLDSCEKQLQKVTRNAKGGDKEAVVQKGLLEQLINHFSEAKPARSLMKTMSTDEKAVIRGFHLLTTKPVMYIANVAEDGFENNPLLDVVRAIAEEEGAIVVPVAHMAALNENTVWTWNAIGKRKGAWALDDDAAEANQGFLLNHLISELLPEKGDGMRYSNSDPVTGQAAWFDLRVRIENVGPMEHASPDFAPIPRVVPQGKDRA